ncbi:Phosphate ABC transporter permease protein [Halorhabdus tiamatea SARL4B]|uniref:Phosphate transport system permease protein PstA n=1 Tax=Halorhabdus tiamatea SARL4B TaxID=1033806 RepID=F7PJC4_9EURY|nr:phosphate ABC transporter permease PstA [Halorhabdus tiamatea]ERJ05466.1 Phosphate ABC transporter permease protein [Halorhabdus tiamatea SARL4B]CCQ33580.1 ABC-type phosphate transporter, inner membrane subunit PstA (TC 3.A.1.7.1) [Halorhabdus tiamatea SARL4B]
MAAESEGAGRLRQATGTRLRRLKGSLFEATLLGATLVGIVSLLVLFGYIAFDTFQPLTASARWYLLYFGTLVAPTAAFTWYARRHPAVGRANAKAFAVVFGALAVSLVTYVVADAVSPYDVLVFLLFGAIPPLLVGVYGRVTDERTYTGPASPLASVAGLAVAALLYGVVRPLVGIAPPWLAYVGITTFPVAGILGAVVSRRWSRRRGVIAATAALVSTLVLAGGLVGVGIDPSFPVVLFSAFVIPVGYVVGSTVVTDPEGRIGVAGPFVLIGGILVGAGLERQLAIDGLQSYLTPTLLLESWHGRVASEAGVYPQLVGSIVVVGFMAILAFPIGIFAAVYLEEYAPKSGWGGRFATLLEVNISNLAGVPSVVYGLLGLALFRRTLGFGTGIVVSAAGTLGLLILPIVVVSAQEAIRAVPDSIREASYGMGASRWQTLRNVVFPEAVPGILTGTILALARAIGETAPLIMIAVATTTYTPPEGLFSSATALPLQIFAARSSALPEFRHGVVPATAIVLLALMLVMNATAVVVRNRYERDK